jgi:hypothetical protein
VVQAGGGGGGARRGVLRTCTFGVVAGRGGGVEGLGPKCRNLTIPNSYRLLHEITLRCTAWHLKDVVHSQISKRRNIRATLAQYNEQFRHRSGSVAPSDHQQHPAQQKGSNWPGTFMSQRAKGLGAPEACLASAAHAYASLTTWFH